MPDQLPYDTVVMIDMQPYFLQFLRAGRMPELALHQRRVLSRCAILDIPVIVLEAADYGATLSPLAKAVRQAPRSVFIEKTTADGFYKTDLSAVLTIWQSRSLLFMGLYATQCVKITARSALQHGYAVVTAPQVIAGRDDQPRHGGIDWFRQVGTVVTLRPTYLTGAGFSKGSG